MKTRNNHGNSQSKDTQAAAPHEAIERRAYEIFEARGQEPGHELEDWLQAESEIYKKSSSLAASHHS